MMKKYGDTIGEGKACVVVRAQGLDQLDHDFWKWLHDEGFTMWHNHGHYDGVDWVFINLNSMVYAPGMPGIKITQPIRDLNGISIEDFKTIWEIYKYREEHSVRSEYVEVNKESRTSGISPSVPAGAHICHIYQMDDAEQAGKDLETEFVKDYGTSVSYHGIELHSNHESEGGGRALVRCKKCGALLLSQHSWYEAMNPDLDGSFYDWLPVWTEEEADLLNIFLDAHEFGDYNSKHLRSNNYKYFWVGEDEPRPMDLPELSRAIALKYEDRLLMYGEEDDKINSVDEAVWQEVLKRHPRVEEMVNAFLDSSPEDVKAWCLILDETDDEELKQLHEIAVSIDSLLRDDETGFANTHFEFMNDPTQNEVAWKKTDDGYAVRLCADSVSNWCQVIHQMGNAMMHCLIDHINPNEKKSVKWAEELICEAAALEILHHFRQHWDEEPIYHRNPDYAEVIGAYLDDLYLRRGTSGILRCRDKYELSQINVNDSLKDKIDEANDLWFRMSADSMVELAKVRNYAIDTLLLNTHYWFEQAPIAPVEYICRLQEHVPGCDVPPGIALTVDLRHRRPDNDEKEEYAMKIRRLRDIPDDFIVFDLADMDDKATKGLCFYQVCVDHDDIMRTELGFREDEGDAIYARESSVDEAVSIMTCAINGINVMERFPGWRDISAEIVKKDDAEDDTEEEYPGIPKKDFDESVELYLENPYWKRYYETAPSELCKEFITMEFYNSNHQTDEAEVILQEMEDELGIEDWKHLLAYCGNNPRRAFIQKVINAILIHDSTNIERVGRALYNPYYQENPAQEEKENDD